MNEWLDFGDTWPEGDDDELWPVGDNADVPASSPRVHRWWPSVMVGVMGVILGAVGAWMGIHRVPSAQTGDPVALAGGNRVAYDNTILVDVHGDVRHPGVYRLSEDARVMDAVRAAGGFIHPEDAAEINGAQPLTDGDEVLIPAAGDAEASAREDAVNAAAVGDERGQSAGVTSGRRVDLNSASEAELETLPGIGPAKAQAIIAYRQAHGGFHSVQDLLQVPGIGPATLSKVEPYIAVSGH